VAVARSLTSAMVSGPLAKTPRLPPASLAGAKEPDPVASPAGAEEPDPLAPVTPFTHLC
jgi:hypothetical protein